MSLTDKTRLELDIEQHERFKTPPVVKIILIILIIALFALGKHAVDLNKELTETKERFKDEKSELEKKIKMLEGQ